MRCIIEVKARGLTRVYHVKRERERVLSGRKEKGLCRQKDAMCEFKKKQGGEMKDVGIKEKNDSLPC